MARDISRFRDPEPSFRERRRANRASDPWTTGYEFSESEYLPPEVAAYLARSRRRPGIWRGVVAGALAGLTAGWVMVQFQKGWGKLAEDTHQEENAPQHSTLATSSPSSEENADATMKAAELIYKNLTGRKLSREVQAKAGPVMHYAFSTAVGAIYGAANEVSKVPRKGFGAPFGAALFVVADEVAVPALKLSKKPQDYPLSTHLYGLASHLVYGTSTELLRRVFRNAIQPA